MARRLAAAISLMLMIVFAAGPGRAAPAYLLTPEEIASLRLLDGRNSSEAFSDRHGKALTRVIKHIAGKRGGKYSGNNWSVYQTFAAFTSGPPEPVVVVQDRYLFGEACRRHSCPEKAAFIVDMRSGHVAFALLHYFTAENVFLDTNPALTQFMMACANPELRAFAAEHFDSWVESKLVTLSPPEVVNPLESKTLTTRC